jgi:predicted nucleotidyltransferase component of viral defense system
MSKGDSTKAQIFIRNYVMERFLERLSLSPYRDNLILKGGALVAAMVGLDIRSTMDIDATIKNLPLSEESARKIIGEITAVSLEDGMIFEVKNVAPIMDETDYTGIRVMLETTLETMRTPLKIDFSTGDVITPAAVSYSFRLMFEERAISILAYNLETVLAEKLETMLSRGTANTRMRDFYDIYVLQNTQAHNIDKAVLSSAFANTGKNRGSEHLTEDTSLILSEIQDSSELQALWKNYRKKFDYASGIDWSDVMLSVRKLMDIVIRYKCDAVEIN